MKDLLQRYSLWIGLVSILIAAGAGVHSCGGTIFGAGSAMSQKAEATKVHVLEVQMAKMQECIEGVRARQERMEIKIDRMLERMK